MMTCNISRKLVSFTRAFIADIRSLCLKASALGNRIFCREEDGYSEYDPQLSKRIILVNRRNWQVIATCYARTVRHGERRLYL